MQHICYYNSGRMNREDFDKILQGIVIPEGTSNEIINEMVQPIREAISEMLPSSLFRYRPCSDLQIEAFEKDEIYAVTADKFNDPYDTLPWFNLDGIIQLVNTFFQSESLEQLKSFLAAGNDFPDEFKKMFPESYWKDVRAGIIAIPDYVEIKEEIAVRKQQGLAQFSSLCPVIADFAKRFSTYACFCEDVQSILMWGHYAESQKGFALEYDFRQTLQTPLPHVLICPVIYSENRYDATDYMTWAFLKMKQMPVICTDISAHMKVALHKSKDWEYEQEWRLIDPRLQDPNNPKSTVTNYRPKAIYYGTGIDKAHLAKLHEIAVRKGIREYEMFIDYGSSKYELQYRPFSVERVKGVVLEDSAFPGVIGKKQMDELSAQAKASPRLRMNMDLRNGPEDQSQRMLNAIEPGSPMPIHRHRNSSETVVCLRGRLVEEFYDDSGRRCTDAIELSPNGPVVALNIPIGQWHTVRALESGTVILECKDGKYEPIGPEDILTL